MDTLPLPPRPDLDQYRKRAKDLVTAARSKEPAAVHAWASLWLESLAKLLGVSITPFVQDSFDRALGAIEARVREGMAASEQKAASSRSPTGSFSSRRRTASRTGPNSRAISGTDRAQARRGGSSKQRPTRW
jgi:hypothetical protein